MRTITSIIIHCADTPASMDIGAKEINRWHVERGWKAIGYNYVIRRNGVIENGRDLDNDGDVDEEVGAHTYGFNSNSIGICLIGGKGGCNFTAAQWKSLAALVKLKTSEFNINKSMVYGHNDLDSGKTCPNFDVTSWVSTL